MFNFDVGNIVYWREPNSYAVVVEIMSDLKIKVVKVATDKFELCHPTDVVELYISSIELVTAEFLEKKQIERKTEFAVVEDQYEEFLGRFKIC